MSTHEKVEKGESEPTRLHVVVVFDDDADWHEIIARKTRDYPFLAFSSLEEATQFFDEQANLNKEQRLVVAAFIVDGNLTESGGEGNTIIDRIRNDTYYEKAPIISNSGAGKLMNSEYDLGKNNDNQINELLDWIRAGRPNES